MKYEVSENESRGNEMKKKNEETELAAI